jgi:hypothetical protein
MASLIMTATLHSSDFVNRMQPTKLHALHELSKSCSFTFLHKNFALNYLNSHLYFWIFLHCYSIVFSVLNTCVFWKLSLEKIYTDFLPKILFSLSYVRIALTYVRTQESVNSLLNKCLDTRPLCLDTRLEFIKTVVFLSFSGTFFILSSNFLIFCYPPIIWCLLLGFSCTSHHFHHLSWNVLPFFDFYWI